MFAALAIVVSAFLSQVTGQDDEFEWFRCDACSATFFQVNQTLVERHSHRSNMPAFDFIEILEGICDEAFTKNEFGVKQHEGKKYLFGPGVVDHIPDKGFGQMGMGDYDKRLAAYCRMFIEEVGEEALHSIFVRDRALDKEQLCQSECSSSASGAVAPPLQPRRSRKPRPQAPPPEPQQKQKRKASRKGSAQNMQPPTPPPASPSGAGPQAATSDTSMKNLEDVVGRLPNLGVMELRWLGEEVIRELTRRATAPSPPTSPGTTGKSEL